ncbi:ABC transporter permease [Paenibacillus sp. J31TS4]|uniref:ABC transporter ATP-binding protein n=1 Tax=Paenibacillus sp. J31TS4 TaxID=2807195 RepID=UPI001B2C1585|nr:ABC transporter ATP-binding protein [Paenibacillus sp. J31TS4]GIP40223.1 ABC transporter permease [Paenibacillus sp. J31TS4]
MKFVKTVLRYMSGARGWLGLVLVCMAVEVGYTVAAPLSLKYLVDEAFLPKNAPVFVLILSLLIGCGALNILAALGGDYGIGKLSGEVIRRLRLELFAHLQKQSLPFYRRYQAGDLVTRFISDMASMETVVRGSFPFTVKETLSMLLGLAMLFAIEWKLTLALLAGSVLLFLGPKLLQRRAEASNASYKEAQERFANLIEERVRGHRTIQSLHQQPRFQQLAHRHIRELFTLGLRLHVTNALMERLPLTSLLLLNGILLGYGGYLIFGDELTVGGFMAFFTLFLSVGQAVSNLTLLIPSLIESSVSFRRVGEVLDHSPDVPEAADAAELPAAIGSLRMDGVSFGYSDDADQLHEVSLQIEAGSYVAFVGPSGSGKSTALQLLARLQDPRRGTVAAGGLDLRRVSEASLRRGVTLVTQDTFLFSGTIRENLLLDSGEAGEEEMLEAARQVNLHAVIASWPAGYDTWVQPGGDSLSGGERQRLAIARALLRKPAVLLLDEVTSALDPVSEAAVHQLLERQRGSRTIVSVTHRLASAAGADRIYVFQEGRIVESGTHEELLSRRGLYRTLWDKQAGLSRRNEDTMNDGKPIPREADPAGVS